MKILAYDIRKDFKKAKKLKVKYVGLDRLLGDSDIISFISLHAPYNPSTHHLINKQNIKKIKKGALLINTARGVGGNGRLNFRLKKRDFGRVMFNVRH